MPTVNYFLQLTTSDYLLLTDGVSRLIIDSEFVAGALICDINMSITTDIMNASITTDSMNTAIETGSLNTTIECH